jgi:hypothetical protein
MSMMSNEIPEATRAHVDMATASSHASTIESSSPEPLAIVGMAFQFPAGAVTEDSFWSMLVEKHCASSEFPADRMNIDAFHSTDRKKSGAVSLTIFESRCRKTNRVRRYTPGRHIF